MQTNLVFKFCTKTKTHNFRNFRSSSGLVKLKRLCEKFVNFQFSSISKFQFWYNQGHFGTSQTFNILTLRLVYLHQPPRFKNCPKIPIHGSTVIKSIWKLINCETNLPSPRILWTYQTRKDWVHQEYFKMHIIEIGHDCVEESLLMIVIPEPFVGQYLSSGCSSKNVWVLQRNYLKLNRDISSGSVFRAMVILRIFLHL